MEDEILKTVHSIFGKSVQIVDCEKTSSVRQEEVVLINGIQVTLDGNDGEAIKSALLTGQVPSVELLNQLLYQAGILRQPVQLETSLSVKSSMVTTEEVSVARGGHVLDGRTSETKEDYIYNSSKKEIWEPVAMKITPERENMAYTPIFRLVRQPDASSLPSPSADEGELQNMATPSCSSVNSPLLLPSATTVVRSATDTTNSISADNSSSRDSYFYKYSGNEQKVEEDDDNDEDDDEDGELYLLNPQLPIHSPKRSATTTIASSSDCSHADLRKKYQNNTALSKSSTTSMSGKKSSLLSYDSGHDGVFLSCSQQTALSNTVCPPSQQPAEDNSNHSISSCYDFTSSDEADFVTATANNSNSNFGKHCKTIMATKERSFVDLNREQPYTSKTSNEKNIRSQFLDNMASMSSSNCVSGNTSTALPKQQQQPHHLRLQNATGASKSSSTNVSAQNVPSGLTSTISTTSVENGLVFRDGNLISGPLDALIAHMVPTSSYYPDRSFIFSFLLSARLFIRPHVLLARISETWEMQHQCQSLDPTSVDVVDEKSVLPQNICCGIGGGGSNRTQQIYPPQSSNQHKAIKSAQNCIQLLAEWIDTFPYDFRDERLMQHVRVLARKCVYIDNSLGKTVSSILQNLVQRLTVLEKYEEFLQTLAVNESKELNSAGDDLATHHKPFSLSLSSGLQTSSGYAHSRPTSSNEREDWNASETSTGAAADNNCSASVGTSNKPSTSNFHETGLSGSQQTQAFHQTYHQSDSGGSLGIGVPTSGISNGVEVTDICDLCPNAALFAYQLTHIELERLSHIGPEEFVQAFAKENHLESFSDMKKTRNLESYVQWFNRLSYFTATEIVKYPKKKQRVRIIEFWIEIARECFNIGNFNSLMAIIAGLNLSPISRLKKTWAKVQSAKFSVLEHQMDPTSNFNSYRSTLKAAMWRSEGATDERERIIIPFFSLLVKDLYFLNEGCSNRLPNGHINFEKFWQLAKQVMEFNTWKKVTCPFKKLPNVITFLQMSPVLNENTLSIASFECEPPENNQEKGRYKTLKSESKQQQQT